jgi:hypothetical protein
VVLPGGTVSSASTSAKIVAAGVSSAASSASNARSVGCFERVDTGGQTQRAGEVDPAEGVLVVPSPASRRLLQHEQCAMNRPGVSGDSCV